MSLARILSCNSTSKHINTSTQCTAHTEGYQVKGVETSAQTGVLGVRVYHLHPHQLLPESGSSVQKALYSHGSHSGLSNSQCREFLGVQRSQPKDERQ